MYRGLSVAVIIPCLDEEGQIGRVLETMPAFVDRLVVVDNGSRDKSAAIIRRQSQKDSRIVLLLRDEEKGVGSAIARGFEWARDQDMDLAAVMAGDGQMDPVYLPAILDPVAGGRADFSKGNRFTDGLQTHVPRVRQFGNRILTFVTRLISGYGFISDSQNGYVAVNQKVLRTIDWRRLYKGYGVPNDLLVKLNMHDFRIAEVSHRAFYPADGKSKMKIWKVALRLPVHLVKLFFQRLWGKYFVRQIHPLLFVYGAGVLCLVLTVVLLIAALGFSGHHEITSVYMKSVRGFGLASVAFLLAAFYFDGLIHKHLQVGDPA